MLCDHTKRREVRGRVAGNCIYREEKGEQIGKYNKALGYVNPGHATHFP